MCGTHKGDLTRAIEENPFEKGFFLKLLSSERFPPIISYKTSI